MLPKNLKYGSKIESAYARSMRSNIQPQNGTGNYNPGDTIIINLPTRSGLCLVSSESYLRFNFNVTNGTDTNAFRWCSGGASGCIQRIRTFHGSNQLEDIDNYGMLTKMLYDLQMPSDANYGRNNILNGTRNDHVYNTYNISTVNGTDAATTQTLANALKTALNTNRSVFQINSGDRVETISGLVASGGTASATYCLSLVSLVGLLCSQNYLPLFEMTSAPLRLEITLVDSIVKALNCLNTTGVTNFFLNNVEFIANFIELSDPAIAMIKDSLGGQPLQFVVPQYRNYVYNQPFANTTSYSLAIPIAAKFSSLKALFITVRDQNTGAATYFPYSSVSRKILEYQFRIGANVFPSKAPNTLPEMFAEALKAIGSLSDINHQPSIEKNSYYLVNSLNTAELLDTSSSISNQQSGSFYIGIDLESYANADKSSLFSGYNTNTSDIYAMLTYGAQTAAGNMRFDTFANFDCVIICENNTAYCKF